MPLLCRRWFQTDTLRGRLEPAYVFRAVHDRTAAAGYGVGNSVLHVAICFAAVATAAVPRGLLPGARVDDRAYAFDTIDGRTVIQRLHAARIRGNNGTVNDAEIRRLYDLVA